jgi:hypothetical protein
VELGLWLTQSGQHQNDQAIDGKCERLGIPKRPDCYAASKSCAEARKRFLEITDRSSLILAALG